MMRSVIFDLDDTLIDTSRLRQFRETRRWRDCVKNCSWTSAYDDIHVVVDFIHDKGGRVGVVTNSVSYYSEAILRHHHIEADALVSYHDTHKKKPDPEPVLLCLKRLRRTADVVVGVGDSMSDFAAYKAAGITALGAGWSLAFDNSPPWEAILERPRDLRRFLKT
jgi:HAD superfamily hydrolase (TIGR01662 family)